MNELELILTEIFHCSRTDLYLNSKTKTFNDREFKSLEKILRKKGRVEPVQYVLGYADFMGLRIKVKRGVLIPRPETELLVETAIDAQKKIKRRSSKLKILDIGTGSGCIAVALAKFLDNPEIVATDISNRALDIAKENARLNNVAGKIQFIEADLFKHEIFKGGVRFDLIVSNPPYVPVAEVSTLGPTVNREPKVALDGGSDGLNFYRKISQEAGKFLDQSGLLMLELGYGQSAHIKKIFSHSWSIAQIIKDYQNIDRVCIIKLNEDATCGTE